jgi:hypothetical protein
VVRTAAVFLEVRAAELASTPQPGRSTGTDRGQLEPWPNGCVGMCGTQQTSTVASRITSDLSLRCKLQRMTIGKLRERADHPQVFPGLSMMATRQPLRPNEPTYLDEYNTAHQALAMISIQGKTEVITASWNVGTHTDSCRSSGRCRISSAQWVQPPRNTRTSGNCCGPFHRRHQHQFW